MAATLNKTALKAAIKAALLAANDNENPDNFEAAMDTLAGAYADATDAFVKSGTVDTIVATPDTLTGTGTGGMT